MLDKTEPQTETQTEDGTTGGQRIGDVVERIESIRTADQKRRTDRQKGVLIDQLEEVEQRLLAFGEALGGDVESVTDLPFTEEPGTDGMPEPLYVRHDTAMLNQVTSWLLQDQHIGLVSEYGTGKSAIREIILRDLRNHDGFVVASLEDPGQTTVRQLFLTVLKAGLQAGYEFESDSYSGLRDGIPWATEDVKRACATVVEAAREDGQTPLLLIDEIELLADELLAPLQSLADVGVRLFLIGSPDGKARVGDLRGGLDSRLRYYDGIAPFEPQDINEYVARSLAYFRDEPFEGQSQELFTPGAIKDIHERTDGIQREVRMECRELFTRAAFVWYRTGQPVERIKITPQLRQRRFGMGQ